MRLFKIFFTALLAFSAYGTHAAEPTHVAIDPSAQHTTYFVALPKALTAEQFQGLKKTLAERKGAFMVSWDEFKAEPKRYVQQFIRRNDYQEVDVVNGMTNLIERYAGTEFGLTWNGGLVVTQSDYRHASQTYRLFLKDPNLPKRLEQRADPVHPLNHLEPLLAR
jgi:hypothetical protein